MGELEESLKNLTKEQLLDFQKRALLPENGYDIWLALLIQNELKKRK